jgi:hypothetical protein
MDRFELARDRLNEITKGCPELQACLRDELVSLIWTIQQQTSAASSTIDQERFVLDQRTRNFCLKTSPPWLYFVERGWTQVNQSDLVGLGEILSANTGILMDRECKRRKPLFFKWMDENWEKIRPIADRITVELRPA